MRPEPSLKTLLSLAWPIVLARATQAVVGFCDALMIAPLGEEALAAVTTGSINIYAAIILPMGTVFILQSFAAQLRGRGDFASIPRYGYYGLLLAVIGGVLGLLSIPLVRPVLSLFSYAPMVEHLMGAYLMIRLVSMLAAVGSEARGNFYGGLGKTRPALVAGVVTMVANVLLNYLLIEPRFGLPGFGVVGAAWASVIASFLGFSVLLAMFLRGIGFERITGKRGLKLSELGRVLRFGLPNGVNWFLEFAAFALFINAVVGHLGTSALAAFNVVIQVNSISFMPAFGVATAGAILVGEAIGRRAHDEVIAIVKLTGACAASWMGAVGAIYLLLPGPIFGLFTQKDASALALLEVGTTMLALSGLWQVFDAVSLTLSETLRAAGDTAWCMGARLVLAWLVFTPLAWIAVFLLDGEVLTVMGAVIAYLGLLAIAFGYRFLSGRWRSIELVGEPAVV
jgi:MATE family multidrug resistance protein